MSFNPTTLSTAETAFSDLHTQQSNMMYYLNNADGSGYVFEIGELDVSQAIAVDPSFADIIETLDGLGDVDATAQIDVSLSQFQGLFGIQVDGSDLEDISSTDVKFRVNQPGDDSVNDCSLGTGNFSVGDQFDGTLVFSGATVKSGNINSAYANQLIKQDFVRHLAKQITGGYASSDIFTNEVNLVTSVSDLDSTINTSLNGLITAQSGLGVKDADYAVGTGSGSKLIAAARQLFNLNLQVGDGGVAGTSRQDQLLADISLASANIAVDGTGTRSVDELNVPLRFHAGDRIAIRVVYHPNSATFAGNGAAISERRYKIFLKLA